jgi:acyl carrier protein
VTGEDRRRAAMYRAEIERGRLERQAASLEDFLSSLRLEVRIEPAAADQLPRVAQLTARTNQMNFSTVRRTEGEVREFLRAGGECLVATVEDRFGGYGLTGVILYTCDNGSLKIDTFLASCRVLGRGVEHRMFRRLGEIAIERGLKRVEATYAASARNRPALLFLESFASQYHLARSGGMRFLIPAEVAAALEYRPVNGKPAYATAPPAPAHAIEPRLDYARIARESRSARTVLERMRERKAAPESAAMAGTAPRTALERELAAMWADLLGAGPVGIDRSFFDLGGHSLMAVQLLSRVRDRYGVNLSLEVVYSGEFTVAELARAIELNQIEQAGGAVYGDLLREVERLTDEEVRAMLDQEEPSRPA